MEQILIELLEEVLDIEGGKMNKDEYKKKYEEITNWFIEETDKITEKLKKEKRFVGLDTNKEEYNPIHKEYSKRLKELKEEYKNSTC